MHILLLVYSIVLMISLDVARIPVFGSLTFPVQSSFPPTWVLVGTVSGLGYLGLLGRDDQCSCFNAFLSAPGTQET
ncbi:hypothetical protein EI94DRAFT_1722926 [Lactarius quietus]|nr:hypothetical protein EI94DRAFT_1722926 [Lactarius quietus]